METDKKIKVLKQGIQIILIVFAAFGGFLFHIAPPGNNVKISVGIGQFITLCILLYISAFSIYSLSLNKKRYKKNYKTWLMICGFAILLTLISSVQYFEKHNQLTERVEAWDMAFAKGTITPESLQICKEENISSEFACEQFLLKNFYTAEQVENGFLWSPKSMKASQMTLLIWYLAFLISLSVSLFSSLELITSNKADDKK